MHVGDQQSAKSGWQKEQRFNGLGCARIDQGGSAGELRDFGDEFACTQFNDFLRPAGSIASFDGYPTGNDDEHARRNLARPEKILVDGVVFDLAESAHAVDLVGRELGKHVLAAGLKHAVAVRL